MLFCTFFCVNSNLIFKNYSYMYFECFQICFWKLTTSFQPNHMLLIYTHEQSWK